MSFLFFLHHLLFSLSPLDRISFCFIWPEADHTFAFSHNSAKNTGIIERKFAAMLTSRLLGVMAKLDYPAATDPMNNKMMSEASRTVQAGSDRAFTVVADVIKVFTSLAGVITQTEYLRRSLTKDNVDLFVIGLIANFVKSAQWLFLGGKQLFPLFSSPLIASL